MSVAMFKLVPLVLMIFEGLSYYLILKILRISVNYVCINFSKKDARAGGIRDRFSSQNLLGN